MLPKNRIYLEFLAQCFLISWAIIGWFVQPSLFILALSLLLMVQEGSRIHIQRSYYGQKLRFHFLSFAGLIVGVFLVQLEWLEGLLIGLALLGFLRCLKQIYQWHNRPQSFWDI